MRSVHDASCIEQPTAAIGMLSSARRNAACFSTMLPCSEHARGENEPEKQRMPANVGKVRQRAVVPTDMSRSNRCSAPRRFIRGLARLVFWAQKVDTLPRLRRQRYNCIVGWRMAVRCAGRYRHEPSRVVREPGCSPSTPRDTSSTAQVSSHKKVPGGKGRCRW